MALKTWWAVSLGAVACGGRTRLDDNSASVAAVGSAAGTTMTASTSGGASSYPEAGGSTPHGGSKTWLAIGGRATFGTSSTGGGLTGGVSNSGGIATGGFLGTGGSPFTGGISNHGGASTAGVPGSAGAAGIAGSASTTHVVGTAGTTSVAGSAGFDGTAGTAGVAGFSAVSTIHLDHAGDIADKGLDLIEAHVYLSDSVLEVQLRLSGVPLSSGGGIGVDLFAIGAFPQFTINIERIEGDLTVKLMAYGLTLGIAPCLALSIDETSGWLVVTLPAAALSDIAITRFAAQAGNSFATDRMQSAEIPIEQGTGPTRNAIAACNAPTQVRRSTVQFKDISLGFDFGCGVDLEGNAHCWGTDEALKTLGPTPSGTFTQVVVSNQWTHQRYFACGLHLEGNIQCWGDNPPTIGGTLLRLGDPYGCAITADGSILCVDGANLVAQQMSGSADPFVDVIGSYLQTCALQQSGSIICTNGTIAPAGTGFVGVELGSDTDTERDGCGLHSSGLLRCGLGYEVPYQFLQIDSPIPGGNIHLGCGVTTMGSVVCWGAGGLASPAVNGPFTKIDVSSTGEGICGYLSDKRLVCWAYGFRASDPIPATTPP